MVSIMEACAGFIIGLEKSQESVNRLCILVKLYCTHSLLSPPHHHHLTKGIILRNLTAPAHMALAEYQNIMIITFQIDAVLDAVLSICVGRY